MFAVIARRANQKKNYDKSDCYGKIAVYTNVLVVAFGICGWLALFIYLALLAVGFWNARWICKRVEFHPELSWMGDLARMIQVSMLAFCISGAALSMAFYDYFLSLLRAEGIEPKIAWRSGAIETVRGFVANGLGYSLLASRPAGDLSYDGRALVTRPLAWDAKPSRVMLVRRSGIALSPAVAPNVRR